VLVNSKFKSFDDIQDPWECLSNPVIVCKRVGNNWYTLRNARDIDEAVMILNNSLNNDLKLFNNADPENYNILTVDSYNYNPQEEFELKDNALDCCVEIYDQYTKEEVDQLSDPIVNCWEIGKRVMDMINKG